MVRVGVALLLLAASAWPSAGEARCEGSSCVESAAEVEDVVLLQAHLGPLESLEEPAPKRPAIITPIVGNWDSCFNVTGSVVPDNRNLVIAFQGGKDLDPNGRAPTHDTSKILYFTNAGGGVQDKGLSKGFLQSLAVDGGAASSVAKKIKSDNWDGLSFDLESLQDFFTGDNPVTTLSAAFEGLHAAGLNVLVSTSHNGDTQQLQEGSIIGADKLLAGLRALTNIEIWAPQMYAGNTPPQCMVPGPIHWPSWKWSAQYTAPAIVQACSQDFHLTLGKTPNATQVVEWLSKRSETWLDWQRVEGFTMWGQPEQKAAWCAALG